MDTNKHESGTAKSRLKEKIGFAVQRKKPRYNAGLVSERRDSAGAERLREAAPMTQGGMVLRRYGKERSLQQGANEKKFAAKLN
jgi:hypothetical protein